MKHFIDFGVGLTKSKEKNILGKTVKVHVLYYIYKSYFWGLIKIPLKFSVTKGWKIAYHINVSYSSELFASFFDSKYECEQIIKDIKENRPEKYIHEI